MDSQNNITLTFDISVGGESLGRREFQQESVTIGKGSAAVLQVDHESISDLHAAVQLGDGDSLMLLDLGSPTGTQLNGEPVNNAAIKDGDVIKMGDVELTLGIVVPEPEEVEETDDGLEAQDEELFETEPAMAFLMRSGQAESDLGIDRRKPKVLEVNEILGDTVLNVKHVGRGSSVYIGDKRQSAIPLSGILGGVPLVIAIFGGITLSAPPPEAQARVDAGELVAPSDLVNPLGSQVAAIASLLGVLGYVAGWLIENRRSQPSQDFLVDGESLPSTHFPLVDRKGSSAAINFNDGWTGTVYREGAEVSLADLVSDGSASKAGGYFSYPMAAGERVLVDTGNVSFFIHEVAAAKPPVVKWTDNFDFVFASVFLLMGFLAMGFGIWIYTTPFDPTQQTVEIPDRFVELLVQEPEREKVKRPEPSGNPDAGEGAKAKDEEGKVGKQDSRVKRAKGTKVAIQQAQVDREIAESAGLLAELNSVSDMQIFGTGGLGQGVSNALGGVIGSQYGTQFGSGGLGSGGTGLGGGGSAEGVGGLGTRGRGQGASGYGTGGGYLGQKGGGAPGVASGDPIILGALDKSEIDRVVKAHLAQIRFCYQRELNKNPGLYGKVVIKFVIAGDGSVSRAEVKTTTLNNSLVEQCICQRFRRFRFPQPRGGGIVMVSYPFVFNSGE